MKPVLRYQSQLLYRRSYKPARRLHFRPRGGKRVNALPVKPWRGDDYELAIQRAAVA